MAPISQPDVRFAELYEHYDSLTTDELVDRYSATPQELSETITHLIAHRQAVRDMELEELAAREHELLRELRAVEVKRLLAELHCFKEIIALQKRLLDIDRQLPPH